MPKGHKDRDSIAAEIKMTRMVHDGAFLVVEGIDDRRFWKYWLHPKCWLVEGEGKQNVVGGIGRLSLHERQGVLGIVDDDYDSLLGVEGHGENVVVTDAHGLECLLCRSRALEKVFAEFGTPAKIRQFEESAGADVRAELLERATIFGRLRWAAALYGLNIRNDAIRVRQFVEQTTWRVDSAGLIRAVVKDGSAHDESVVSKCLESLPTADGWRVAHSKDILAILRIGLMHVLGDLKPNVGTDQIAQVLRVAMSSEDLQGTALWADIRTWEQNTGKGYLVLAD